MSRLLLDTGPLVAYLDRREAYHPWARERFQELQPPFFTCEPVITEACFLLRHLPGAIDEIGGMLRRRLIWVSFSLDKEAAGIFRLIQQYRDLPMSLADACLVAMVERGIGDRVLTLDGDFKVYRHSGRRVVPVLMPEV